MRATAHDIVLAESEPVADVGGYLRNTHARFRNSIHATTRVFTCRAWPSPEPYELHWNDNEVPGETFIGQYGWVSEHIQADVEAELAAGRAVRLFIFNSDADLCFQYALVPRPRARFAWW